ncbi:MAG: DNA primase [Candidatus Tectomicrobia bacterium]|nr:DNA primase [Candidatus Tectomicrobia bacterium]
MAQGSSADLLQQLRERADIVEVVSDYLSLEARGKNHRALCPFHREKTPSFTVTREKGIFYCFGCGAGGDALKFLQLINNISFPEAVQVLARRYGVRLPSRRAPVSDAETQHRQQLFACLDLAREFFHRQLLEQGGTGRAAAYLQGRGMTQETIESFHLGYAPESWDALLRFASGRGYDPRVLAEAGLVKERATGSGYYDRFRDRLIFPIQDVDGRTVGFGGRLLENRDDQPKYLNTPETAIYRKYALLYGLAQARESIRRARQTVLVEGYFDLLSCHQAGVRQVVATCGTALTEGHVRLLQRFAPEVVVAFDGDPAGRRAAGRGETLFLTHGLRVRVAQLPAGEDPDSFVRKTGGAAFEGVLAQAPPLIEFLIALAIEQHGLASVEARTAVIRDLLEPLRRVQDHLARSSYLSLLADRTQVPRDTIMRELRRQSRKDEEPAPGGGDMGRRDVRSFTERQLLSIMLQFPERIPQVREALQGVAFREPPFQKLATFLFDQEKLGQSLELREILPIIPAEDLRRMAASLALQPIGETGTSIEELIADHTKNLRCRQEGVAAKELIARMKEAERAGRGQEALDLRAESMALRARKRPHSSVS